MNPTPTAIEKLREEFLKKWATDADYFNGCKEMRKDLDALLSRPEETKQEGEEVINHNLDMTHCAPCCMACGGTKILNEECAAYKKKNPPSPSQPEQERKETEGDRIAYNIELGQSLLAPVPSETKQGEKEEKTAKDASEEINKLIETEWELYVGLPSSNKLKALLFSFAQKVSRIIEKNLSNYLATPSPLSHPGTILHGKEGEEKSGIDELVLSALIIGARRGARLADKFISHTEAERLIDKSTVERITSRIYAALAVKWPECPMKIGINDYQHGYQQAWKDCINECKKAHSGQSQ